MNPRTKKIILIVIAILIIALITVFAIIVIGINVASNTGDDALIAKSKEIEEKTKSNQIEEEQVNEEVSQEDIDKFDEYLNNAISNQTQNDMENNQNQIEQNTIEQEEQTNDETISLDSYQGDKVEGKRVKELIQKLREDITEVDVQSNTQMILSLKEQEGNLGLSKKILEVIEDGKTYQVRLGNDGTIEGINRIKIVTNIEEGI